MEKRRSYREQTLIYIMQLILANSWAGEFQGKAHWAHKPYFGHEVKIKADRSQCKQTAT